MELNISEVTENMYDQIPENIGDVAEEILSIINKSRS